jgi:hypothetical protein
MAWGKKAKFVPVIKMPVESEADHWAVEMVYSLHADITSVMQTERSKQRHIGISEIGTECDKCLCRKLSGLYAPELPDSSNWLAQIGTFGHSGLEEHFGKIHPIPKGLTPTPQAPHYHLERRLQIRDWLGGNSDMYVEGGIHNGAAFGIVDDWKFQGTKKIAEKTGKGEISRTYYVQMNVYGLGYEQIGLPVSHLLLYALPRDAELDAARPVLMRYDRQVALDAIARCEQFQAIAEIVGWEALIERQKTAAQAGLKEKCWDCDRFDALERNSFFDGLIPS